MRKLTGGSRSVRVEKFSFLFRDVCKLNEKVLIYPFAAGCIANDFAPGNAEISSHFAYPHSHTKRHLCIQIVHPERSQKKRHQNSYPFLARRPNKSCKCIWQNKWKESRVSVFWQTISIQFTKSFVRNLF